jgi:hypothetical protein
MSGQARKHKESKREELGLKSARSGYDMSTEAEEYVRIRAKIRDEKRESADEMKQ